MSSLAHWNDPAFRIAEHYRIGWSTSQYLLVHLLGGALTALLGDAELVCRFLYIALTVGWVQSSRLLLRAFGHDQRLAAMSAVLFWNRAVVIGFLPYVASLPILFVTLALFVPVSRSESPPPSRSQQLVLATLAIVVFYTHASAFTLLTSVACGLSASDIVRRRPGAVRRIAWLLPALVFAGAWLVRGRFGASGASIHDTGEIGTMSPLRAIRLIALYSHDTWTSHLDDWVGVGFWCCFLVLLLTGERGKAKSNGSLVPFVVTFLVYLATPLRVGTGVLLNVRMAPLLGLFALLGVRPARGPRGTLPIVFSIGLLFVQAIDNVRVMSGLQNDVAGLPTLLASLPKGARLITLSFSGFDPEAAHFTPWLHVGSYHRVLNGGVASFSFSDLPHWSVQYRPEHAPPKQDELSWGMRPCLYRNERDGAYFDFVLVRGALDPFASDPPGPRWRVRGRTAKYTLFEKDVTQAPRLSDSAEDKGPCANGGTR